MSVSLGGAFCACVNLCMHIDKVSDRYSIVDTVSANKVLNILYLLLLTFMIS